MIIEILNLLEGWEELSLNDTLTLNSNETKYISLPNEGIITHALITTTSEYTNISIGRFTASPQYLNTVGLYKTRPIGLETLTSPYAILFAPLQPYSYKKNTRLQFYQPLNTTATVAYLIAGVQIIDKDAFKESLKEILGNPTTIIPKTTETHVEKTLIEVVKKQHEITTSTQELLKILKEITQNLQFFR